MCRDSMHEALKQRRRPLRAKKIDVFGKWLSLQILCVLVLIISGTEISAEAGNRKTVEAAEVEGSLRKRWCHREWPSPGKWKEEAPYWESNGCPNLPFGVEETVKCMKGRTLYVIGNSVARQAAFGMVEMLGGGSVKRENQRDMCPKHETFWGDSCHQEFAGVKIRYLFMQFMDGFNYTQRHGFPFYRQPNPDKNNTLVTGHLINALPGQGVTPDYFAPGSMWADDNCISQLTRSCLEQFFSESKKEDILIFTLGMSYGLYSEESDNMKSPVDTRSWLLASATNFKAHIAATFRGQTFRVTLAQLNKHGNVANMTPMMNEVNKALWNLWRPGNEPMPWYTIDQWAINENKDHLYNDHVHFNGKLTHAMLHQVLNELCPGGGLPGPVAWPNHNLKGKLVRVVPSDSFGREELYYVGATQEEDIGYLHKVLIQTAPEEKNNTNGSASVEVPFYLKNREQVKMSRAEANLVSEAQLPMPILTDGMVIKGTADKTVFLVKDNLRHAFPNGGIFMKLGFQFEEVKVIHQWIINMLPQGSDVT